MPSHLRSLSRFAEPLGDFSSLLRYACWQIALVNVKYPKGNETVIMCSPEAKEVFRKFSNELEKETFYHGDKKQFVTRGREHTARLAGFLVPLKENRPSLNP